MTTTEAPTTDNTAPPVTPCPIWCALPPGHPWTDRDVRVLGDHGRRHSLHPFGRDVELWASETADGLDDGVGVIVGDGEGVECNNRADTERLISEIRAAADIAFPTAEQQAERAVLAAVRAWTTGRAPANQIAVAYDTYAAVTCAAGRNPSEATDA